MCKHCRQTTILHDGEPLTALHYAAGGVKQRLSVTRISRFRFGSLPVIVTRST